MKTFRCLSDWKILTLAFQLKSSLQFKEKSENFTKRLAVQSIILIYGLFNDDVSSSDYKASHCTVINEEWPGKDMEGSGPGLSSGRLLYRHLLRRTEEKLEKPRSG
jgi:hypothetical protein